MDIIDSYTNIKENEWDELLSNGIGSSAFQTREYFQFWNSLAEAAPFVFALPGNKGLKLLLSGVILKEQSSLISYFTHRAIIYGGIVISSNEELSEGEFIHFLYTVQARLNKKAIYIEIRNLSDYSKYKEYFIKAGWKFQEHLNYNVNIENLAEANNLMSKSKIRQVKKSIKKGANYEVATSKDDIRSFYEILKILYRKKVKKPLPSLNFFFEFFKRNLGVFLLVRYEGRIIGGIMCPIYKNSTIYEWYICGEDKKYQNVYPSVLATYAAIEYGNQNGLCCFDFMGAGEPSKDYGVRDFKSKFGGELIAPGRFLKILKPTYYYLGKTVMGFLKSNS